MQRKRATARAFFGLIARHRLGFSLAFTCRLGASLLAGLSVSALSPLLRVLFGRSEPPALPFGKSLAWLSRLIDDTLLSVPPQRAVATLAIFVVVLYSAKFLFEYGARVLSVRVDEGVARDIRNNFYSRLVRKPLSFFRAHLSGELLSRFINDVNLTRTALTFGLFVFITEGINVVVYLGIALLASARLTLFTLVVAPLAMGLIVLTGRKIRKRSVRAQERMAQVGEQLSESIAGARVIKAFSGEDGAERSFRARTEQYFRAALRREYVGGLGSPLTELLSALAAVLILTYSANLIFVERSLSPDMFMVFLVAFLSVMRPIKQFFQANTPVQQGLAAYGRLQELVEGEEEEPDRGEKFPGLGKELRLEGVSFSYGPGNEALKGVDLTIHRGETVALVGPSGAGKSTLADLLGRFIAPAEGRLTLDGEEVSRYSLKSWRQAVAFVPQETFLFSSDVLSNVWIGNPSASEEEVRGAVRAAHGEEFVSRLPQGFKTPLGERGASLSGGERQRIALARALLARPEIIVLDEATSALDSESEQAVQRGLSDALQGRTAVVIAHRLSTVVDADRIVVMDRGRVIDQGTHAELLARCRLYSRLAKLQLAGT